MEYPPETAWGGIGSYVACMAPALAARGHEVHVLSCVNGQVAGDTIDRGVHVHRRDQARVKGLGQLTSAFGLHQTCQRLLTGVSTYFAARRLPTGFDVIECPDYGAEGLLFALLKDRRLVCCVHSPVWASTSPEAISPGRDMDWAESLEHFAMRRARAVTAASTHLVDLVRANRDLSGVFVAPVPYPIDLRTWSSVGPVQNPSPVVMFIGRLESNKAPEVLVDAMTRVRRAVPEARAVFVGKSSGRREGLSYLEWLQDRAGASGGCHFLGRRPLSELLQHLNESRVVVVPSWRENYSLVAVEAMAAGRPVVVTTTNGVAELVDESGAGATIPPGDPDALAAALIPYLRDMGHAAGVGAIARAAALAQHDPDRVAVLREQVYERVVERRNGLVKRAWLWQTRQG
jgi:glycosyltransferase involved in cell wall biosynthesis